MSLRALSYALVMTLAHTPRQKLSSEEIDALCQLAYELLNKITKTHDIFQETRHSCLTPRLRLQPFSALTRGYDGLLEISYSAKPCRAIAVTRRRGDMVGGDFTRSEL